MMVNTSANHKHFDENQQLTSEQLDFVENSELYRLAREKRPIFLPWHNKHTVQLGTCVHVSKFATQSSPWNERNSPFQLEDLSQATRTLTYLLGTVASYKSINTSKQTETLDHLSLEFGVGVGLPFVASVSVKGSYDRDVEENKDSDKSSIQSSVRVGNVNLVDPPKLTEEAASRLSRHGMYAFEDRYGDYYVAGYRVGADTAILISASASRTKKKEKLGVTVTAEVLFISKSVHHEKDFYHFDASKSLKLLGYDTLAAQNWKESCDGPENGEAFKILYNKVIELSENTHKMTNRVESKLQELGLQSGDHLTMEQCDALTKAGLVVELVLHPIRNLREAIGLRLE